VQALLERPRVVVRDVPEPADLHQISVRPLRQRSRAGSAVSLTVPSAARSTR
jgi:hypothetical protein